MSSPDAEQVDEVSEVLSAKDVAAMFGKCPSWFYQKKTVLESQGFPKRDLLLGGWSRIAVKGWFDRRAGVAPASPFAQRTREIKERASAAKEHQAR